MRNYSYEQKTVDQVVARVPEAGRVLRSYGIDPTSRLTLAQAAAVTSAPVDEMLAVMEIKARRAMQRQLAKREADAPRANPLFEEIEEGELVA